MVGNPELIDQYRQIHATTKYGDTSVKNLRFIRPEIQLLAPKSVIDYGCGQSQLVDRLDLPAETRCYRYDPAIPKYSGRPPEVSDLLINIDVLEHIEEIDLDEVLVDMRSLCRDVLIIVDTKPASFTLPDGRNAHVTVRTHNWWQHRLAQHFGALTPIKVARSSRAGFRTWRRKPGDAVRFQLKRIAETTKFLLNSR